MVKMFDKSLRRTYELLGEQLQQARQKKKLKMKVGFEFYFPELLLSTSESDIVLTSTVRLFSWGIF